MPIQNGQASQVPIFAPTNEALQKKLPNSEKSLLRGLKQADALVENGATSSILQQHMVSGNLAPKNLSEATGGIQTWFEATQIVVTPATHKGGKPTAHLLHKASGDMLARAQILKSIPVGDYGTIHVIDSVLAAKS